MKMRKKWVILTASVVLAATAMAGCGNNGSTTSPSPATSQSNEKDKAKAKAAPTEISVMTVFYSQEPPSDDNPILKEIEKRTNTKVKINWVSPNNYNDKMNVTLSSGDIPDLMLIMDPNASTYKSMAKQGAFWDLTDLYKTYQNLTGFPKESWFNSSLEGKNYGIPRVRPVDGDFVVQLRKDWLDKLQLKVPTTTAELYEVMKAFAQNDPDGNGKNDTYGMAGDFGNIERAFLQSYGGRKLVDGKLVSTIFDPKEKDYLTWIANAYKEKLIPEDFAVLKGTQVKDMLKAGKVGVTPVDTLEATWDYTSELRKTVPNADFVAIPALNGIAQKSSGFFGIYVIPKQKVSQEKLKKILEFMDYGSGEEGGTLATYGIKDVHYSEQDGFKVATPQAQTDNVSAQALGQLFQKFDPYTARAYRSGMPKEIFERNKKVIDERAKISQADPAVGLISETDIKLGPDYWKKISDLKIKIIMNKLPLSAWDEYVNELKNDKNFLQIDKEFTDAYNKRLGK